MASSVPAILQAPVTGGLVRMAHPTRIMPLACFGGVFEYRFPSVSSHIRSASTDPMMMNAIPRSRDSPRKNDNARCVGKIRATSAGTQMTRNYWLLRWAIATACA